jgi:hypothetical protein
MDDRQRSDLSNILRDWVGQHPRPDEPTLVYLGRDYSPRDILEEVMQGTTFGESLGDFLYAAARRFSVSVQVFISRAINANKVP